MSIASVRLVSRCGDPEKYQDGAIQANYILVGQAADARADPGFRNGGYLVDH